MLGVSITGIILQAYMAHLIFQIFQCVFIIHLKMFPSSILPGLQILGNVLYLLSNKTKFQSDSFQVFMLG